MSFDALASAAYWNERNKKEAKALSQRIGEARTEAVRLAEILKKQAGVETVILFGSLAEGLVHSSLFDIDLALVGGDVSKAQLLAEQSSFPVDLLSYETLPPHVRQRVDRFGLIL